MFEFSSASYRRMIEAIRDGGYRLIQFRDLHAQIRQGKTCLLRHDIDLSMDFALDMAKTEYEMGVKSTYFVMLRSPMYNLMSLHGMRMLDSLVQRGHEIGLHFDANELRPGETVRMRLATDVEVLNRLLPRPISAFSFHQPTQEVIDERIVLPEIINTYHPEHLSAYKYISDSNRVWRDINPFEIANHGYDHVHLLVHPVWWFANGESTENCWDDAIRVNFERMQSQLVTRERAYGPPRELLLRRQR